MLCATLSLCTTRPSALWGQGGSEQGWPSGVLQILARCDIMVLQEVVDASNKTISFLLEELRR